ncbi:MAG: hypothetical protein D6798_10375 [Deltaproteobacteria bacterium]|nr:MAG: hypothetical protein D6798_10375 [Deltaproteobacteria bacterium]
MPSRSPIAADNTLVDRTIDTFQPHYSEPLTRSEAVEIIDNFTTFVRLLAQADLNDRPWPRGEDRRADPGRLRDTQPAEPGDPR